MTRVLAAVVCLIASMLLGCAATEEGVRKLEDPPTQLAFYILETNASKSSLAMGGAATHRPPSPYTTPCKPVSNDIALRFGCVVELRILRDEERASPLNPEPLISNVSPPQSCAFSGLIL